MGDLIKTKINWKVTITVFLVGLGIVGFIAALVAVLADNFMTAVILALFTVVSFSVAAGLSEGDANGKNA